ncbi:hypothetical protein [Streptomyces javensis]|uniref:DUF2304 domain-containing protein n=1 Tax=Streptomyces javensis TaxID=114698 RepID=A0ABS0R7K1_9ACTN|nr:hypothetical protein [Streptomyces javensis]MBI0313364.1 hypothetical protein [Streptomyces javensis]
MIVSVSTVLLLGAVLGLMLRNRALGPGGATIAALFGFCLASTGAAPAINDALQSLADSLSRIG